MSSQAEQLRKALIDAISSPQEIICENNGRAQSVRSLLYHHRRWMAVSTPSLKNIRIEVKDNIIQLFFNGKSSGILTIRKKGGKVDAK